MSDPIIYVIQKVLRYFMWAIITVLTGIMLILSDHYLFGTALNLIRVPLLGILIYVIWRSVQNRNPPIRNIGALLFTILAIHTINRYIGYENTAPLIGKSSHLKVLSVNLDEEEKNYNHVISLILDNKSDVVVFQEFTPQWQIALDRKIGKKYRFKVRDARVGKSGLAVYSIHHVKLIKSVLDDDKNPIAQLIELTNASYRSLLVNAHLNSGVDRFNNYVALDELDYVQKNAEWQQLSFEIDNYFEEYDKCILSGDLNTSSVEPLYQDFRRDFVDCKIESNNAWLSGLPIISKMSWPIRLDHFFTKGKIQPIRFKIIDNDNLRKKAIQVTLKL
jgi:endonuclease/exonuclease/phosphatase (EEP) superfamily protein YafD